VALEALAKVGHITFPWVRRTMGVVEEGLGYNITAIECSRKGTESHDGSLHPLPKNTILAFFRWAVFIPPDGLLLAFKG